MCPPTTIRTPTRSVCGPIRCAESNCSLRLSIALPVLSTQHKTPPIFDFHPYFPAPIMHPPTTIRLPVAVFLDLFHALNPTVQSVCAYVPWLPVRRVRFW